MDHFNNIKIIYIYIILESNLLLKFLTINSNQINLFHNNNIVIVLNIFSQNIRRLWSVLLRHLVI